MKREGITFVLTDDEVIENLIDHIKDCDMDELANIVGNVFGGCCTVEEEDEDDVSNFEYIYKFEPTKDYGGAFGKLEQ